MSGLLVSALALVAGPGAVVAQSAARAALPNAALVMPSGPADSGRPVLRLAVVAQGAARDYAISLSPARRGGITTTLDYRMTPNGPIGSIGFPSGDDTPYVDRAYLNPAETMGYVRPEVVVGAKVAYRF